MRPRVLGSLALVLSIAVACQTAPITGRRQLIIMSPQQEMQMGVQAYAEVVQKSKVASAPAVREQVVRVGRRIAAVAERPDFQWEFTVIEDKQANAFCLPGGKIAVYTGILPITRDDAGLAAVLGHEVAHATARHGAERISQAQAAGVVVAGLGAAASIYTGDAATGQTLAQLLGLGATVGFILPWGRTQESEADHLGLIYMAKAGYHPRAARDLWVRMAEAAQGRSQPPEFLSTHPSHETRIRDIESLLPEALGYYRPQ
jgi:predicted Zn-dependent protease